MVIGASITATVAVVSTAFAMVISAIIGRPKEIRLLREDVTKAWQEIDKLKDRAEALESSNTALQEHLSHAQSRLSAAIAYVAELIRWVEGGAHAPVPRPDQSIAHEVVLPPSWMEAPVHPITEHEEHDH